MCSIPTSIFCVGDDIFFDSWNKGYVV
jgi:hypothetical protein